MLGGAGVVFFPRYLYLPTVSKSSLDSGVSAYNDFRWRYGCDPSGFRKFRNRPGASVFDSCSPGAPALHSMSRSWILANHCEPRSIPFSEIVKSPSALHCQQSGGWRQNLVAGRSGRFRNNPNNNEFFFFSFFLFLLSIHEEFYYSDY